MCHRHGMRYVPYYWAQREPQAVGQTHPEWRCRNRAGKPTGYYCVNTPYRDLVRNRIVELVKDIGVDGIFFDMFHTRKTNATAMRAGRVPSAHRPGPAVKEDFDNLLWQQWVDFK